MGKLATALQVLLGAIFLFSGIAKLTGSVGDLRTDLDIPTWFWTTTGAIEVAGAVGLLLALRVTWLAAPAALGMAGVMVGAIVAHLRAGDMSAVLISPAMLLLLSLVIVSVRWDLFTSPETDTINQSG